MVGVKNKHIKSRARKNFDTLKKIIVGTDTPIKKNGSGKSRVTYKLKKEIRYPKMLNRAVSSKTVRRSHVRDSQKIKLRNNSKTAHKEEADTEINNNMNFVKDITRFSSSNINTGQNDYESFDMVSSPSVQAQNAITCFQGNHSNKYDDTQYVREQNDLYFALENIFMENVNSIEQQCIIENEDNMLRESLINSQEMSDKSLLSISSQTSENSDRSHTTSNDALSPDLPDLFVMEDILQNTPEHEYYPHRVQ